MLNLKSPVDKVAAYIRSVVDTEKTPIYIGRLPKEKSDFISLSRGRSQGVMYGYGDLAYLYTTVDIVCRSKDYSSVEGLLMNTIGVLVDAPGIWINSFSQVRPKRAGDIECLEISMMVETLDRIA